MIRPELDPGTPVPPPPRRWMVVLPNGRPFELRASAPATTEVKGDAEEVARMLGGRAVDADEWSSERRRVA